jgi:hypothetical protein
VVGAFSIRGHANANVLWEYVLITISNAMNHVMIQLIGIHLVDVSLDGIAPGTQIAVEESATAKLIWSIFMIFIEQPRNAVK